MCDCVRMLGKLLVFLLIVTFVHRSMGLKCRVETDNKNDKDMQDVVRACMNIKDEGNERNGNQWQHNRGSQRNSNTKNDNEDEVEQTYTHYQQTKNNNKNQNENWQFRRQNEDWSNRNRNENRDFGNQNRKFGSQNENQPYGNRDFFNQRKNHTSQNKPRKNISPLKEIDPCIIHCIFQQMKMLDDNSQPDRFSVVSVMTEHIRDPELKNFIHESVIDCFEEIEAENPDGNNCNISKSFAMCLEKKGEQNCEDWNEDDPNKRNRVTNMNNKYYG